MGYHSYDHSTDESNCTPAQFPVDGDKYPEKSTEVLGFNVGLGFYSILLEQVFGSMGEPTNVVSLFHEPNQDSGLPFACPPDITA